MNNSISNSPFARTSLAHLSRSLNTSRIPTALHANSGLQGTPATSTLVENRMSVVNLEAGISALSSFAQDKVNHMSLLYRFGQTSRSRITASLMGNLSSGAHPSLLRQ